jgi:polar amino acid transport system substrate-binding protein
LTPDAARASVAAVNPREGPNDFQISSLMNDPKALHLAFADVIDEPWFLVIDIIGTAAFALSGITIARAERYSLVGALVLAFLPALGGGLVVDLIVGHRPVTILGNPLYMYAILVTVGVAYLFLAAIDQLKGRSLLFFDAVHWYLTLARRLRPTELLVVFDAIGLTAFTVAGVLIAIQFNSQPLWLWAPIFAAINSAGGLIVRDMLRADASNPVLKGVFYAEVSIVWGLALVVFLIQVDLLYVPHGVVATLVGAFVTRIVVHRMGWHAPMF